MDNLNTLQPRNHNNNMLGVSKKMRKRKELDALVSNSYQNKKNNASHTHSKNKHFMNLNKSNNGGSEISVHNNYNIDSNNLLYEENNSSDDNQYFWCKNNNQQKPQPLSLSLKNKLSRNRTMSSSSSSSSSLSVMTCSKNNSPPSSNSNASCLSSICCCLSCCWSKQTRYLFCSKRFVRFCSVMFVLICILSIFSIIYLFLDIKQQTSFLRRQLDEVVAGNQYIPDELQKWNSLSKQLEHNQTELFNKFNSIATQIKNFSIQISELHITISKVEEKLNASPQVVDIPARLSELSINVASFGSTISDLNNTVNKIKEKSEQYDANNHRLETNVTSLKDMMEKLAKSNLTTNNTLNEKLVRTVDQIQVNLTNINETLDTKLKWLKNDQQKDHKSIEDLQGGNVNISTRVSSLQVDINSLTSTLNVIMSDLIQLNTSLHQATSTLAPHSPLDFSLFDSNSPKLSPSNGQSISIESTSGTQYEQNTKQMKN